MQQNDLLIEIHTEELPPKSLHTLAKQFENGITTRLQKLDLSFAKVDYFATPRRLAVLVHQLTFQQPDKTIERKGPALDKAYDAEKNPTPACIGFAKSCGIDVKALITLPSGFVGCKQDIKGKTVFELLPSVVEETLGGLPIPKPMRWGSYTHKFIRPVHSVIMLYGDKVIDAEILGCKTGNKTRGHRFLHPEWVTIKKPTDYAAVLKKAFVIASFEERREKIIAEIKETKKKNRYTTDVFPEDAELLDEVTSLVEWPKALCGSFDERFLEVPLEALTAAMKDHQRYFPIYSGINQLSPHFITISNIESIDEKRVIAGNERVLRARLSDAAFFYATDKKIKLADRLEKLKHIIFQNKLGTLFDKTERVQKLAVYIAKTTEHDVALAEQAALLAKTDLTTELVGEFPELQGIAGYYYALHEGKSQELAKALSDQYRPRFSGDALPDTSTGWILALADRLDTLVGVFGINQIPTGDKDPFGLRRAALGILRILIEKKINLDLFELIKIAAGNFPALENKNVVTDVFNFILERLKPWYQEQNISTDVITAITSLNLTKPYDIHCRIQAVMAFKKLPEAEALSSANKRVNNILAKYTGKIAAEKVDTALFEAEAEKVLAEQLIAHEKQVNTLSEAAQYQAILEQLASLRLPVDNFFDQVMVMTDDQPRRENRLLMLKKLRDLFLHVADIGLLQ